MATFVDPQHDAVVTVREPPGSGDLVQRLARPLPLIVMLAIALVAFALLRGLDHDESQYVAAAALVADRLLPYRDFAYLQTPLQPLAFAPIAWIFGSWTWPGLRIVNALLGVIVVAASWRAMHESGVGHRTAMWCAGLLATCDILLFSTGTARNDALPAAMLACALVSMLRAERGEGSRTGAVMVGLLLAGAAAAKLSYAVPGAMYGVYALIVRRHRPGWVILGALPGVALVTMCAVAAPVGFWFGTLTFPTAAPTEYYTAVGKLWKLGGAAKLVDTLKFLALGPALVALVVVGLHRGERRLTLLAWLILAGFVAALLPSPTWRQYLLPMLPPLFVRLAQVWQSQPPGRATRIAAVVFAGAGLAPTVEAMLSPHGLTTAMRESAAIGVALEEAQITGDVATLAPQFLPRRNIDPRFATGPFYFRSRGLLGPATEDIVHVIGRDTLAARFHSAPPAAILVGGEGPWTSGDARLDARLEGWAIGAGWRRVAIRSGRFRLYAPPQATMAGTVSPSIAAR